MDTKTFLFFLKRSKPLRCGECPIYMRITINGVRKEFSTQVSVEERSWNRHRQRASHTASRQAHINAVLDSYESRFQEIWLDHIREGKKLTADLMRQSLLNAQETPEQPGLLDLFSLHNQDMEDLVGIDFARGTLKRYRATMSVISRFIHKTGKRPDIPVTEIDHDWLARLERHLKVHNRNGHNTAMKHLQNIRKILHLAVKRGQLERNPFDTFRITTKPVNRAFLSDRELRTLMDLDLPDRRLAEVLDVFLFCCFTGLSYSDVRDLRRNDIQEDDSGRFICKPRQKTKEIYTVPLVGGACKILNRYQDHAACMFAGKALPVKSNQKMNQYLKEIAGLANIQKPLSMHVARHTFATTVALDNGVSIHSIQKILGHSNIRITQEYARMNRRVLMREMGQVAECFG